MALTKVSGSILKDPLNLGGQVSIGGTLTYEDVTNIDSIGIVTARSGVNVSGGNLQIGGTNVINSGRALYNLESLKLGDSKELILGTGNDLKIYHSGSHSFIDEVGNGALKIKGDDIRFENASGTEAARIDSSGRVLIGTFTEGVAGGNNLTIYANGASGMSIRSGTTSEGSIFFSDDTSGVGEYRGYIQYDHNDDSFEMGSNSARWLRVDSNRVVTIGNASFGGSSGVIAYGSDGGLRKDALLALNASATVSGRGAGVSVGGNSSALGSFYCNKSGNADSDGGNVFLESVGELRFNTNGSNTRLTISSTGQLILNATAGGSVALLKAGGTNTDLRVASVGTGGFFDVQTQGVDNRMRVDANGHFYTNGQRTRLTYGDTTACSLRWNILSSRNLTQSGSNRDNYGKVNIQAGRANSTTVNDDCTAIRITPAENRSTTTSTKSCGIGFQHLNADTWPQYSGNQVWMGLSIHDTPGQERDKFEIHMNSGTAQGSQPNKLAMRLHPDGEMTRPNQPMFFGMGANGGFPGSTWYNIRPSSIAFDTSGGHISSGTYNGGYEVPVDGTYMCIMNGLVYVLGENQFAQSRWHKNGSQYGQVIQFNGNTGNHTNHCHTVLMECSGGDKINQQIWTNSGGAYGSQWHFIVYLVG